jgi:hypothetical protein
VFQYLGALGLKLPKEQGTAQHVAHRRLLYRFIGHTRK